MKYWVYKDSQILGPLAKEDFALAGGLRPDTLVCTEDSAGRMDTDWRAAEDVEELSGAWSSAPSLPAEDGLTRPDLGVMERLRFETLGPLGEATGEDWLAELFSSESRLPAEEISRAAGPSATQETLKELTEQINRLSQRLEELEGGKVLPPPDAAPEQAKPAAPPAPKAGETRPRQAEAPRKSAPTPQAKPAAAVPDALASLPDIIVSRPAEAAPADKPAARSAAAKPAAAPPPESAGAPGGQTSGLQFRERPRRVVKFAAAKSLPSASKGGAAMAGPDRMSSAAGLRKAASGPAPLGAPPQAPAPSASPVIKPRIENAITTPPGASPYQWAPPAAAQAGIPQAGVPQAAAAGPMAGLPPLSATPPPLVLQPVANPPAPAFAPSSFSPPTASTLEAPPVPAFGESPPTPVVLPPATMAFSGAGKPVTSPGITIQPNVGPSTQEVLAKLAKPKPAKTEAPAQPKRRQKAFLVAIGLAAAGLVGAGWFFFFRDARDIKTAVTMDSGRAPVGGEVPDDAFSGAGPKPGTFATRPAPQAPAPAAPAQPQAAAPAPAPAPSVRDERPAAIELVKSFPLEDDRGTIGAWLQYSYPPDPANGSTEKWDAGAVEESVYTVIYTVQRPGREAINYIFEGDVARRTVRGTNAAARELLAGGAPPQKAKPAKPRDRKKPAVRRRAAAAAPKSVPLLPLPSDSDLQPPADEGSGFQSDTVQPNL